MWFYVHNKEAEGPVSEEILHGLLQAEILPADVLVWQEGRESWLPADSVFMSLAGEQGFAVLGGTATVVPPPIPGAERHEGETAPVDGAMVTAAAVPALETPETPETPDPLPDRPRRNTKANLFVFLMLALLFVGILTMMLTKRIHSTADPLTTRLAPPTPTVASRFVQPPPPTPTPLRTIPKPAVATPPSTSVPVPRPTILPPSIVGGTTWPPPNPKDFYFMMRTGGELYVLGKKESVQTLATKGRLPHAGRFQRSPEDVVFEVDPNDPAMFNRLFTKYNQLSGSTPLDVADMQSFSAGNATKTVTPIVYVAKKPPPNPDANWRRTLPKFQARTFPADTEVFWELETSKGKILVKFMPQTAPNHVSNFYYLTNLGYFDGLKFHRVIPGFMAQGGCPFGRGNGGPGYKFDGEFDPAVKHDRPGLLSMANAGPGTDGSQFFLTFVPTQFLDGKHTIFGEIVEGMEVLNAIEALGSRSGQTSEEVTIKSALIGLRGGQAFSAPLIAQYDKPTGAHDDFVIMERHGDRYILGHWESEASLQQDPQKHQFVRYYGAGPDGEDLYFERRSPDQILQHKRLVYTYDQRFGTSLSNTKQDREPRYIVPDRTGDLFLMTRSPGGGLRIAGTREGIAARARPRQFPRGSAVFSGPQYSEYLTFEIDPYHPALLERLVQRYNKIHGTNLSADQAKKHGSDGKMTGPNFNNTSWRSSLPKFPEVVFPANRAAYLKLATTEGDIRVKFMPDVAPNHVSNFVWLTMIGYFDGLDFHRVIPGFMAQGGCPLGTGTGGPGYRFDGEFDPKISHDRPGLLSMANMGPGTDGSQFFLTFAPAKHLDGRHTIFGEVDQGMNVLRSIEGLGRSNGTPTKPIKILRATVEWGPK